MATPENVFEASQGESPLITTAIHDGHAVRDDVARELALPEPQRFREEDPYTARWTVVAPTRFVGLRSRFEVDLNRPREQAVYRKPEDAWGLEVWRSSPPPASLVERSLAEYDAFYAAVRETLEEKARRYGRFVVFDLHSYNHRRDGAGGPPADPAENPEVNIGTGTMDRNRWARIVDRAMAELGGFDFGGRRLDVRENVRFRGGNFPRWVHETFPENGCALAIEFKKFFMDEWTGEVDEASMRQIVNALERAAAGVVEELERL